MGSAAVVAAWFTEGWPAPLVALLWLVWIVLAFGPTFVLVLGIHAARRRPGFARDCGRLGLLAGALAGPASVGVMIFLSSDREFVGMALMLIGPPFLLFQVVVLLVPWLVLRSRLRTVEQYRTRPESSQQSGSPPNG